MENTKPEAGTASGVISAPVTSEKPAFDASVREAVCAVLMYAAAFAFTYLLLSDMTAAQLKWTILARSGVHIAFVETICRHKKRTWESLFFAACFIAPTAGLAFQRFSVWNAWHQSLFLASFGVWYPLSRSGALIEGKTGRYLFFDAVLGAVADPLENLFLRFRCARLGLRRLIRRNRRGPSLNRVLWGVTGLIISCALLSLACSLLGLADDRFAALTDTIRSAFRCTPTDREAAAAVISLPIGAYLFGLIAGGARKSSEALTGRRRIVDSLLDALRRIPGYLFVAAIGAFCLMYLAFFIIQSGYLFGAFTRTLPDGFIVSEYARKGFFELCMVCGVNFTMTWLALRLSDRSAGENKALKAACMILTIQSALFCVVAISKLCLYIDCFGFTPLRLQSSWLVLALFAGCLCAGASLASGRTTARIWVVFCAATLCALCLW